MQLLRTGFSLIALLVLIAVTLMANPSPYPPGGSPGYPGCAWVSRGVSCSACYAYGSYQWAACQAGYNPECRVWWVECSPSGFPPG